MNCGVPIKKIVVNVNIKSGSPKIRSDDAYFTPREIAQDAISLGVKTVGCDWDMVIEPSAGDGAFSDYLGEYFPCPVEAIDIAPRSPQISQRDFMTYKPPPQFGNILVIGNPPFGRNGAGVRKFFNHAAKWATVIAFIVPKSFRRPDKFNGLDTMFHQVLDTDLCSGKMKFHVPDGGFKEVNCCFQIWERRRIPRNIVKLSTAVPGGLWTFISANNNKHSDGTLVQPPPEADLAVLAHGSNIGRVILKPADGWPERQLKGTAEQRLSPKSWHWIKCNSISPEILSEQIKNLDYENEKNNVAGGQQSIGKGMLMKLYREKYNS